MLSSCQIFRYAVPARTVTKKHWFYVRKLSYDCPEIVCEFGPWALNTPKNVLAAGARPPLTHFGVLRAQQTCLVAANVVLFLLNDI